MMKKISVVLADHHPIVREGLRTLLNAQADIEVVAEGDNSACALALTKKHKPELLLLEMAMPGCSVRHIVRQMQRGSLATAILVFTCQKEEQHAAPVMRAGARGFISKTTPPQEILTATRKIAAGGVFISPELAQRIALSSFDESGSKESVQRLSCREQEVLIQLASGATVNDIAKRLHLSPKTISTHKSRICQKLGIRGTFDLVRYALDHGMG